MHEIRRYIDPFDLLKHHNENTFSDQNFEFMMNLFADFLSKKTEKFTYFVDINKCFINSFLPSFPSQSWNQLMNGLYAIANGERIPFQADLVVTGRCQCECWHCFRVKYPQIQELSFEKIVDIFGELKSLGTATIGITGGEPMLREDIGAIINAIPDGIEGQLYTTGINITDDFIGLISKSNLSRCIISLDHYQPEIVCDLRKCKTAYKDAVDAVQRCVQGGIYTVVTLCVTENLLLEDHLERYFQFAKSLSVHEVRIVMPIPQGKLENNSVASLYGKALRQLIDLKKMHYAELDSPTIVLFSELESSSYWGCGAGVNYITVNNDGNVMPCVAVPLSFGNVHNNSLNKIYKNMQAYFPCSSCACYGISSNHIMQEKHVKISEPPLDYKTSISIAKECKIASKQANFFEYIKSNMSVRGNTV